MHAQLAEHIDDPQLLDLLWQYLHRTVYDDGLYEDIEQGISLGCPLSPLMGALFLDVLDRRVEGTGLCYVRFMDDWVVLAPTRWKLREAVAVVNQTLDELRVQQHPDKTFIGRVSRGFDFLGYRFSPSGLGVARPTVQRFVERVNRLYEQGADSLRIGQYVRRWCRWLVAGLLAAEQRLLDGLLCSWVLLFDWQIPSSFALASVARDANCNEPAPDNTCRWLRNDIARRRAD